MSDERLLREKLALLEAKKKHEKNLPHKYGWKNYQWFTDFFETNNRTALLCAANQISKDLENSTLIPTPFGFKKMIDLKIGDFVFAQDGSPTRVIDIPYEGTGPGYRVTFSDGSSVVCGPNHDWVCKGGSERFRKKKSTWVNGKRAYVENDQYDKWVVRSLKDIIDIGGYSPKTTPWFKHSIPVNGPVDFEGTDLPLDPYFFGYMLGNGCIAESVSSAKVTINDLDTDIVERIITPNGGRQVGKEIDYQFPASVLKVFTDLKLRHKSVEKYVPDIYLFQSKELRLELLRGLMDSDGTTTGAQHTSFTTTSEKLANQVKFLVCSWGGIAEIKRYEAGYKKEGVYIQCRDAFMVNIWAVENPFWSKRKSEKWKRSYRYKHERVIESIEPIGEISSRCITVEHSSGTFLCTEDFIVTHNSSSQIRKVISLAIEKELWPKYFRQKPKLFWYFYPTQTMATTEFRAKWVQDFLPKGEYKNHPEYGWRDEYRNRGDIFAIHFNSGVSLYFKSYEQDAQALQASSVDYIALDEELPEELWDELNFRRNATDGMLSMVFTATLGQEFWRKAIEPKPSEKPLFPDAWKRQVSMFDCQYYEDGTPTQWSTERIHKTISMCRSEAEVQRRVYGRFVKDSGLKYQQFDRGKNVVPVSQFSEPPPNWVRYVGIDLGAGGADNHPSTITFIAVKPDYRKAVVFKHWRGDKAPTTMTDVVNQYMEMAQGESVAAVFYDYAAKEFQLVASRMGISVLPADKGVDMGEQVLNALFRHQMLDIWDMPENEPIVGELMSLTVGTDKRKAKDDSVDSVRYAVTRIPWDWSSVEKQLVVLETVEKRVIDPVQASTLERERDRRRMVANNFNEDLNKDITLELDEWADYLDQSF